MSRVALIIFVFFLASGAFAQLPGNPDNWCRQGFFTRDSEKFGVGTIKGKKGARAYFHDDDSEKCPETSSCRSKSYVLAGDKVITNRVRGNFVCAWFAPLKGHPTVGWLKLADVDLPNMLSDGSESVWLGEWRYASNTIRFARTKTNGVVKVTGNAFWQGFGDNIHIGELAGIAKPADGLLEYSDGTGEYDCRAKMRLAAEKFLIVADNMNCGGANVTFSGVYRKSTQKSAKK